jgi:UPF0755 protein
MSSRSVIKTIIYVILAIFILAGIEVGRLYHQIYGPNIKTPGKEDFFLKVPTGSSYKDVVDLLNENNLIRSKKTFDWAASKKKYPQNVHPGRYRLRNNMSNNELVNMLRSGHQEPVNLVINVARTPEDLAGRIAAQIEADSLEILDLMNNEEVLKQYEFSRQTIIGMFVPNTYEFFWNTSAEGFFKRMHKEYNRFWNGIRKSRAEEIHLTPNEVTTLASILNNESNKEDEYGRIAGVYINRLHKGMKLQADPTVKYALKDFERQRILTADTYFDSPYNTYMYAGLPPGPICLPTVKAIDAVLNYEKHNYLYFCAKDDFSGYHNFASTIDQHNKNARSYQKALNRRKILK